MEKYNEGRKRLVHELQIHQIELEMQNEELKRINSELEFSLKRYTDLYSFAPISFFTINEKYEITNANSTAIKLLGIDRDVLNRSHIQDFIVKDSIINFNVFSRDVFETDIKQSCELVFTQRDGRDIYTYVDGVSMKNEEGKRKKMLLAVTDVSNYRIIEKELAEAQLMNKLKAEFFSNISHELRTPLNVIFSSLQLIELYKRKENSTINSLKLDNHHRVIKQNCRRLIRLVNNLIDSTRIDTGFYEPHFHNEDIVQIIREITLSVMQFAESKNISLEFIADIDQEIIQCDQELIERVILNILSNAMKFTNRGGNIVVNMQKEEEEIIISVKDNGIGIPKEKLQLIFERFKQVDRGLTRDHEGSGIGLNLARSIVKMHGGSIFVESVFAQGSEFIIKLPIRVVEQENINNGKKYKEKQQNQVERTEIEFSDIYF